MLEKMIEAFLVKRVEARGGMCLKQEWINTRGAPDRLVLLPEGNIMMIELKQKGVKPEDHQRRMHNRLRALGVQVEVVDSVEAVEALIK
jgi:hypothetical protein